MSEILQANNPAYHFHKVDRVNPVDDFVLAVRFEDGSGCNYDLKPLIAKSTVFSHITKGLFEQVKVDMGGYGVSWNDEIDLSCDELYYNGVRV